MEFLISRESLLTPLQVVSGAVEKRHTLPILSNLLLRVDEQSLWITGTDLEVELLANAELLSECVPGTITVPARKFLDIVKSLPSDVDIKFVAEGDKARITAGRGKYTLSTLPSDDFPNLEDSSFDVEFEIERRALKKLIDKTSFSMAQQDVRYYLNGLSIETENQIVRAVATDGHRLAISSCSLEGYQLPGRQVIVPRKGVLEVSRLLDDSEQPLKVQFGTNHIRVFSQDYVFTSKLVDGRFPDYRRVLPDSPDKVLAFDRVVLKGAFTRALILTNEKLKFRGVRLNFENNELKITANNPEQEQAEEVIDVDYNDESMEIGFNVSYLIDVLNAIDEEQVVFKLTDSNSSALIQSANDDSAQYVIMPMRL